VQKFRLFRPQGILDYLRDLSPSSAMIPETTDGDDVPFSCNDLSQNADARASTTKNDFVRLNLKKDSSFLPCLPLS
jgi:hypothetical protein